MFFIFLNFYFKIFLLMILLLFSFLIFFFSDFIILWFLMEISNFIFIAYISLSMKNKKMIFFYFLIQIIASSILILSILINNSLFWNNIFYFLTLLSLFIKLALPPFHYWMLMLVNYLPWDTLFILLSLQKIIPFYLISFFILLNNFMYLFFLILTLTLCSLIPPIFMMNLINFKKLLTYSSINQSGWMMLLIMIKNLMWITYFLFYSLFLLFTIYFINYFKFFYNFFFNYKINLNLIFLFSFLNIASLPPFSFFFFKWFSIFLFLFNSNFYFLLILMMFSSFILLYIYINMMIMSMFLWIKKIKLIHFKNLFFNTYHNFIFLINFFSSMIIMIL